MYVLGPKQTCLVLPFVSNCFVHWVFLVGVFVLVYHLNTWRHGARQSWITSENYTIYENQEIVSNWWFQPWRKFYCKLGSSSDVAMKTAKIPTHTLRHQPGLLRDHRPKVQKHCSFWHFWLVGGFNHIEKYESQWEGLSHILWKNNVWLKPPTSWWWPNLASKHILHTAYSSQQASLPDDLSDLSWAFKVVSTVLKHRHKAKWP